MIRCRNRLVTPRVLHVCWKNLGVYCDPLSDICHHDGPYVSMQLSPKAYAIVSTEIFVRETVSTNLENRSVVTSRNRFPVLTVSSRLRVSIAMHSSAAVAENSCMPLLFLQWVTLFLAHLTQLYMVALQSNDMLGQKKHRRRIWYKRRPPRCLAASA